MHACGTSAGCVEFQPNQSGFLLKWGKAEHYKAGNIFKPGKCTKLKVKVSEGAALMGDPTRSDINHPSSPDKHSDE